MAIDQGTTSTRAILFDYIGKVIGVKQKEHEQFFPNPAPNDCFASLQHFVPPSPHPIRGLCRFAPRGEDFLDIQSHTFFGF
jgi:hypothetical protein